MSKKPGQNTDIIKSLEKEAIKKATEESHAQLTRVGGWASGGSKRVIADAINKGIRKLSR